MTVADRRVRAHQDESLLLLGLRQHVIAGAGAAHFAGHHARLAQAAVAVAATIARRDAGLERGFEQGVVAFDQEFAPRGAQGGAGRDNTQYVVHDGEGVLFRLTGENRGESSAELHGNRVERRRGCRALELTKPRPRGLDELVVAREMAAQFGQLETLREQALRQHLLARQHALAYTAPERFVAHPGHALEGAAVVDPTLQIAAGKDAA